MNDLELLASGYGTIEGPTFDARGNLYFSDVTNGGVRRLTPDGDIELAVPRRRGVAGIVAHRDGGVVVSGRDISHVRDGETRVLLGGDDYAANGLADVTGFNDIAADEAGQVLAGTVRMADPRQKIITSDQDGRNSIERLPGTLVLITAEKTAQTLAEGFWGGTNGMAVDPRRQRLYLAHTRAREVAVLDMADGGCRIEASFPTEAVSAIGTPDGLVLDDEGCIWLALHKGGCIARFSPEGALLSRLELPAAFVDSMCFGGPDGTDLYIVTGDNSRDPSLGGCIFRTNVGVRGLPVPMAAI